DKLYKILNEDTDNNFDNNLVNNYNNEYFENIDDDLKERCFDTSMDNISEDDKFLETYFAKRR
ncbi:10409_t:CDS:2, partial [Gigaspora margarita]